MATSMGEAAEQIESTTGQIELECQLVQEQLITLTTARTELLREFEQLIGGSARLLLQIQEDASPASERKLHKYEAQKRLLEEKLTSLETELRQKAEKLAELDSKAGDYLLKMSSSGCFAEEDEELSCEGQEMLREAVLAEMLNAEINAESNLEGAAAAIDSSSDAEMCSYNVKENGKLFDLDELNNISEDTVEAFFSDNIPVKSTNNSVENEVKQMPDSSECVEKNITETKRQPSSEIPSSEVEEAVTSNVSGKTVGSLTGTEIAAVTQSDVSVPIVIVADNTVTDNSTTVVEETKAAVVEVVTGTENAAVVQCEVSVPVVNDADSTIKDNTTAVVEETKAAVEVVMDTVTIGKVIDEAKSTSSVEGISAISNKDSIPEESKDKISNIPSTGDQNNVEDTIVINVTSAICEPENVIDKSENESEQVIVPVDTPIVDQNNVEETKVTNGTSAILDPEHVTDKSVNSSANVDEPIPESEQVKVSVEESHINNTSTSDQSNVESEQVKVPVEASHIINTPTDDQSNVESKQVKEPVEASHINNAPTEDQSNVEHIEITNVASVICNSEHITDESEHNLANVEKLPESEQVKESIEESQTQSEEIAATHKETIVDDLSGKKTYLTKIGESVSIVDIPTTLSEELSTATELTADIVVPVVSNKVEESFATSLVQSALSQVIEKTDEKSPSDDSLTQASEVLSDSIAENISEASLKDGESKSETVITKIDETKLTEELISKEPDILQNDVENSAPSISEVALSACNSDDVTKTVNSTGNVKKSGSESPVLDQMASLATLVSDLRRVKEDMGKCMSVKEQSFIDLEDQLEATKAELAIVKESMGKMTNVIKQKDETCEKMEEENKSKKIDIELKMKEIQEVTNKCSMLETEKEEVLRKMEVLEIMMTEYRTEIELLVVEKTNIEEETKQLLAAKQAALTAQIEIDSQPTTELENAMIMVNGDATPNAEAVVVTTESVKEDESSSQPSAAEVCKDIHKTAELTGEENSESIEEKDIEPEKPTEEELQSLQAAVDEIYATTPAIYEARTKDVNVQYDINEEIDILRNKVESLEKEKNAATSKLKVNNKHLKIMDKDRKHKQKECELLRSKVEKVELKMCELQGTFDVLVKAIMNERDELIREVEEKSAHLTQLDTTLTETKERHEQELEKAQMQKKIIENELEKYQTGQLSNATSVVDSTELEAAKAENEKLSALLSKKAEETREMISKNQEVHKEMQDFINFLKEERTRLQQDTDKAITEKETIMETFSILQSEHKLVTNTNITLEKSVTCLEAAQKEKENSFEGLKQQLEDLQKQLEDLNTKNFNLTSEMYQKDEEYKEELTAREGTIQELNTTLTNNQKQSRDNYKQLQEDSAELETRLSTSLKESQALVRDLEGKIKTVEDSKNKEIQQLQSHIATIRDNKEKIVVEKAVIFEKLLQSQNTMLRRVSANKEEASTQSEDSDCSCKTAATLSLESVSDESITSDPEPTSPSEDKGPYEGQERIRALTTELESMRNNWQHDQEEKQRETLKLEERRKSPNNTDFGSQEEFERLIAAKESKIGDLESKVNELESALVSKNGYIAKLEGQLETTSEIQDVRQTVEQQVEQINKLSEDISKLKEELEQTYKECALLKNTVDELENSKQTMTVEKDKIVKEYEEKLQQACGNVEQANADIELKKKLG